MRYGVLGMALCLFISVAVGQGVSDYSAVVAACNQSGQYSINTQSQLGTLTTTIAGLSDKMNSMQSDIQKFKLVAEKLNPDEIKGYYNKIKDDAIGLTRQAVNPVVLFGIPLLYFTFLGLFMYVSLRGYYSSKIEESEKRYGSLLREIAFLKESLGVPVVPEAFKQGKQEKRHEPTKDDQALKKLEDDLRKEKDSRKKLLEANRKLMEEMNKGL